MDTKTVRADAIKIGDHLVTDAGVGPRILFTKNELQAVRIETINGGSKWFNPWDLVSVTHNYPNVYGAVVGFVDLL